MVRRWQRFFLGVLALAAIAGADDSDGSSTSDPLLMYRPPFAKSLPIQLLINGVILTLMSVLFLQLLFTAQYHFRLAPVNFSLQLAGVTTLLVTSISTIQVIMSTLAQESRTWPYMLNYVAVDIPPDVTSNWTTSKRAAWLLMTATTGMLIQITHIQFLTLLFPSKLERRLIFALLFPLAVTSATMQMLRISPLSKFDRAVVAVQNVCNATLSLLFTISLFFWGLVINRANAWRTDGGTAAFGFGALALAPMSTAISLMYIPSQDQYTWMKPLMWSVIEWQSFMGWWWWVGAGMSLGQFEEDRWALEEERATRKSRGRERRRKRREKAGQVWKGVVDVFGFGDKTGGAEDAQHTYPPPQSASPSASGPTSVATDSRRPRPGNGQVFVQYARNFMVFLRQQHFVAAREQAAEWVERVNEVYGREEGYSGAPRGRGWGLGEYGARRAIGEDLDGRTEIELDEFVSRSDVDSIERARKAHESDTEVESAEEGSSRRRRRKGRMTVPDDRSSGSGLEQEDVHDGERRVRRRGRRREELSHADADTLPPLEHAPPDTRPGSMWWWGPLKRWRLHDTTEY